MLDQVVFTASSTPINTSTQLVSYSEFETMVANTESFILTITNQTCACTVEFIPLFNQYLTTMNIPGYTLEYTQVLYQQNKHGLPVTDANSPILTVFDHGILKYSRAYKVGDANYNRTFTNYDELARYLGDRIDVIVS